jgi:hypothetical protein
MLIYCLVSGLQDQDGRQREHSHQENCQGKHQASHYYIFIIILFIFFYFRSFVYNYIFSNFYSIGSGSVIGNPDADLEARKMTKINK